MSGPLEFNDVSATPEGFADEVDRQLAARVRTAMPRTERPTPDLGDWTYEIADPDGDTPVPFISGKVCQIVETALTVEVPAIERAIQRLLALLGPEALSERVRRRVHGGRAELGAGILPGRAHELVVDRSLVVWRGEWIADAEGARWESRWLVDPEGLDHA